MQEITGQEITGSNLSGQDITGQELAGGNTSGGETTSAESPSSRLWFSPDYRPQVQTSPSRAIQLPPGKPKRSVQEHYAIPFHDKSIKILIWSDSEASARTIEEKLSDAGYPNISFATSHKEGLTQIDANTFDFFIIDLELEGVGLKIVQALRASARYKSVPLLICTESQQVSNMLQAMKAGANDLICKPINASLLSRKIALHSKMMPLA